MCSLNVTLRGITSVFNPTGHCGRPSFILSTSFSKSRFVYTKSTNPIEQKNIDKQNGKIILIRQRAYAHVCQFINYNYNYGKHLYVQSDCLNACKKWVLNIPVSSLNLRPIAIIMLHRINQSMYHLVIYSFHRKSVEIFAKIKT